MDIQQEKREEKKQKKSKENNNNNNRAREAVIVVDGAVKIAVYSEPWQKGFTTALMNDYLRRTKLTPWQCKAWLDYMVSVGWVFSTGGAVTPKNCMRSMRMWRKIDERLAAENASALSSATHGNAKQNEYEVIKKREQVKRVKQAMKSENWELCAERCAMFREGKCVCGAKIPPQLRERPIAPQECEQYAAKEVR